MVRVLLPLLTRPCLVLPFRVVHQRNFLLLRGRLTRLSPAAIRLPKVLASRITDPQPDSLRVPADFQSLLLPCHFPRLIRIRSMRDGVLWGRVKHLVLRCSLLNDPCRLQVDFLQVLQQHFFSNNFLWVPLRQALLCLVCVHRQVFLLDPLLSLLPVRQQVFMCRQ